MNSSPLWRGLTVVTCLFFIFLPGEEPASSEPWRPEPPDAAELAVLEDLSHWVAEDTEQAEGGRRPYGLSRKLRQLIRERSESFEVFRAFSDEEARREIVHALPYGKSIALAAKTHQVDPLLLAAIVEAESNFRPGVVSPVGAVGLAQVMPTTAEELGALDLQNPSINLDLGARYLKEQLLRFDGSLELAVAAYNAGPYAVKRHDGVPPYRETQRYVEKVLSIYVEHHQNLWRSSEVRGLLLG